MRNNGNVIYIRDPEGVQTPFDAETLESRLITAFLSTGRRNETMHAADITLAVEYALRKLPRPEPVFGQHELESAVIRLLEEAGFPDVAKAFRYGGSAENQLVVDADRHTLHSLLMRHLNTPAESFEYVLDRVMNAAAVLELNSASPRLWLELARHYSAASAEQSIRGPLPAPPQSVSLSAEEVAARLPVQAAMLMRQGILRVAPLNPLFPCWHFYFFMGRLAEMANLTPPLTELEILPAIYRSGAVLSDGAKSLNSSVDEPLPTLLSLPDLFDFAARYADGSEGFALSAADALTGCFDPPLYKVSFH